MRITVSHNPKINFNKIKTFSISTTNSNLNFSTNPKQSASNKNTTIISLPQSVSNKTQICFIHRKLFGTKHN